MAQDKSSKRPEQEIPFVFRLHPRAAAPCSGHRRIMPVFPYMRKIIP